MWLLWYCLLYIKIWYKVTLSRGLLNHPIWSCDLQASHYPWQTGRQGEYPINDSNLHCAYLIWHIYFYLYIYIFIYLKHLIIHAHTNTLPTIYPTQLVTSYSTPSSYLLSIVYYFWEVRMSARSPCLYVNPSFTLFNQ